MNTYRCIIVEDEPLAAEKVKAYIARVPFLELTAMFDNALDAVGYLKQNDVGIIFLDIKMDELSGIELLESVAVKAHVIITTAYQEYALKGYELQITDYLLKPFPFTRFLQAIAKVQENIRRSTFTHPNFIFIKTEHRLEKIFLDDILYIEGMRDYRRIHTRNARIMTLQNFSELEKLIPSSQVCRIHKSYMVSLDKIDSIERNRVRIGDQLIPISESYRDQLMRVINVR